MPHSATQCHAQKFTTLPHLPHLILLGWEIYVSVCVGGGVITKVAAGGFPLCPHLDLIVAPVACGKPGHREQGFLDDLKVHSTHWLCK